MTQNSLLSGPFWIWLVAKQFSDISVSLNTIVISVYALSLFDDPSVLGIILALKMMGSVGGAFLVPWLSHRWPHRTILISSDFANAVLMLILGFAPAVAHPMLVLVLPIFMGLFQGAFHVALYSQTQYFLGPERRIHMNGILASMDGVAVVAGGILASIVYGLIPVKLIFLIDGATFLLSAIAFAFVGFHRSKIKSNMAETHASHSNLKGLSVAIVRSIIISVGLVFAARFVEAFGSATHNVGFPIISAAFDPHNQAFLVGWIMAVWGLGKIMAAAVTSRMVWFLGRRRVSESSIFIVFLMLTFAFFLGTFSTNFLWLILIFAFLAGLFDASTETVYYTMLQHSQVARTDQLISLSYLIERAGMGLGIILVGYSFSTASPQAVSGFYYLGSMTVCICLLIFSFITWKRSCKST